MKTKLLFTFVGIISCCVTVTTIRADVLEMQNGDRYSGKVLAVSTDTVVLNSEILGKINVPRSKVATLTIGTSVPKPKVSGISLPSLATNLPVATPPASANGSDDLSAMLQQVGSNTNFIGQIRQQLLAGSPEAGAKFDEMVNGLFSGQISVTDLRKQAQSSAQQLRALKRELGPEADDALDGYLKILDAFVNETATEPGAKSN